MHPCVCSAGAQSVKRVAQSVALRFTPAAELRSAQAIRQVCYRRIRVASTPRPWRDPRLGTPSG